MSAVAVIIAAVFWVLLWGPVGILLSTPLTVWLVVIGRYVPRFKILSTLLGEEVELKTFMRFYQRMLATDEHRAWEILREHFDGSDINTTGDQVIVVLPKGGFAQARFLCRSIRGEGFTGPIVIACLGNFTYYDQLFVKFRKAGASSVTTSFSQTHAKIESILKRRENVTDIARQQLNPVVV